MDEKRLKLVEKIETELKQMKSRDAVLKKAVELIDAFSDGYNWTGFYMMKNGALEVGPYIGPETPHVKIGLNEGICGAAAMKKETVVVDDVNSDPRFLACSISTRSEIVVPLMDGDICLGEIDIDSNHPAFFSDDDRIMLEKISTVITKQLKETGE